MTLWRAGCTTGRTWLCLVPALMLCGHHASAGQHLRAGAAQTDITPPKGTDLWGYGSRKGPAIGTKDPLLARVLVFEAEDQRVAILTLDLGRTFGEASLRKLREEVARTSHIGYVFAAASHTHSGPVILDEYEQTPPWESEALRRIESATAEAVAHLADARIGTGYGIAYIGHNRLKVNADRSVTWFERNPTKVPTAPFDPTVAVLRVDGASGTPIAVLVNYACHPVVFGPDNLEFSADYPAITAQVVKEKFGPNVVAMFIQGGDGDINPYYAVTALQQDADSRREWTGRELGQAAVRVAESIHTTSSETPSLQFSEHPIRVRMRWDQKIFREAMAGSFGIDFEKKFGPPVREKIDLPVATLLIDRRIAFVGLPGEPFLDFQTNLRSRSPVRDVFFAGYANGYHGYFPTIEQATLGAYGASSTTTWVEPGAGERMIDHSLVELNTMLGRLSSDPFRPH